MTEPITEGTLWHLDPNDLTLEDNVRPDQALTKQFIASIKENGVLVPIVAVRYPDGELMVRAGARRTMAAREAGLATVPVYVTGADTDTVTRLTTQITENDQRAALSAKDRVLGIQAMLDTGLSPTKVAKKLAVSMERVKQSKAAAASAVALEALSNKTITLDEAAAIAEFEGDQDSVDRLLQCAGGRYFDHEVSRLRQARESKKQWDRAAARYRSEGYEVLTEAPQYHDKFHVPMRALETADGKPVEAVADPKHWAVLIDEESVITDKETGEVIPEEEVDWGTEDRPEAIPQEGYRHVDSIIETVGWVATEFYCTDTVAAGLVVEERYAKLSGAGGLSTRDPDIAAAQDNLAAQREKRERRKVIALNKAAEAAESVRREFVKAMLGRKNPPKGSAVFVAQMLAADGYLLSNFKADEVITELLGVGPTVRGAGSDLLDSNTTDARAQVVILGLVLGAMEARTPKGAWRETNAHFVGPRDYLRFLVDQGYTLSAVEQVMVGEKKADDVHAELEAAK